MRRELRDARAAGDHCPRFDRAGVAVEQGRAVQEEGRGERAEQEVLERRLLGEQPAVPGEPADQVEREREHLQRHEHGQQVVGGREEQHAADREHESAGRPRWSASPARVASRSCCEPGTDGALRGERVLVLRLGACRSAITRKPTTARSPGSCPAGTGWCRRWRPRPARDLARRRCASASTAANAATSADQRQRRPGSGSGRRAARTPRPARRAVAAPNTMSIGESLPNSTCGAGTARRSPSRRRAMLVLTAGSLAERAGGDRSAAPCGVGHRPGRASSVGSTAGLMYVRQDARARSRARGSARAAGRPPRARGG